MTGIFLLIVFMVAMEWPSLQPTEQKKTEEAADGRQQLS